MITVEVERCTGCGACVLACREGAVELVAGVARIENLGCTECGECVEACPEGALRMAVPVPARVPAAGPIQESPAARTGTLAAVLGTALAFVGREVAPRVATLLLDRMERGPAESGGATKEQPNSAGNGARRRYRGGRGSGR